MIEEFKIDSVNNIGGLTIVNNTHIIYKKDLYRINYQIANDFCCSTFLFHVDYSLYIINGELYSLFFYNKIVNGYR